MIHATQLRTGMMIVHEGDLYRVASVRHLTPGNEASTALRPWYPSRLRRNPPKHPPSLYELRRVRHSHSSTGLRPWSSAKADKRGFVQTKLKNLKTGTGIEVKFRSEDRVERATLETRTMQYLYDDGDLHTFMDMENYEQILLSETEIGDLLPYLLPTQIVEIEFFGGSSVGISLPSAVELKVAETQPALKGATASASYKPAKLETGITIQVPPFIEEGDLVRVDPWEEKYLERVSY